jgi:hypothetical protein
MQQQMWLPPMHLEPMQGMMCDREPEIVFVSDHQGLYPQQYSQHGTQSTVRSIQASSDSNTANTAMLPSDQGMLSVVVQRSSSYFQSDLYSGSDSSTANTAVQQSRGAALLTQQLGNYVTT